MSDIHVKISRTYRGIPYSVEASLADFSVFGKIVQHIETFIDTVS